MKKNHVVESPIEDVEKDIVDILGDIEEEKE